MYDLTHPEWRPQNIYVRQEEINLYCIIKHWQQKFLYFHYKSVKLDQFCVDIIKYMYEHLAILSNLKSC